MVIYFSQTFSLVCPLRTVDVSLLFNGFPSPVDFGIKLVEKKKGG